MTKTWRILTLNSGSSSIKFSLYEAGADERLRVMGEAERIGLAGGLFWMKDPSGALLRNQQLTMADHDAALKVLFHALREHLQEGLDAAGHRVVHGGTRYSHPQWIDSGLPAELYHLIPLAPNHLPHEIKAIVAIQNLYPGLPQVACFDTALLKDEIPRTESLRDVVTCFLPHWQDTIASQVKSGKCVLIVVHGNSLRALVKYLDDLSEEEIVGLNIPTDIPLLYDLDADLEPIRKTYFGDPRSRQQGCARRRQSGRSREIARG